MFLGDKGKPYKFHKIRRNFDIIIDNPRLTIQKLSRNLGFYTVMPLGRTSCLEIAYDTDKKLLTGAGLILRKKIENNRTYFSLVRISSMDNVAEREKKSFLGECEQNDQPSDFPVQIAEGVNKVFNNLFTINVVDIIKHCTPYIRNEIIADTFRIVSGTGYEATCAFETWKIRDLRTGRKAVKRNFTLVMEDDPNYAQEREHILSVIDHNCKELFFVNQSRFEIAEKAVAIPEQKPDKTEKKKKRMSKKEIEESLEEKEEQE